MTSLLLRNWPAALIVLIIASCQSSVEKVSKPVTNKFNDPEIVRIYALIDQRKTDSLLSYLNHQNASHRYEAALGFGSIQDTTVIGPLSLALTDSSSKVRKAAAYALGQTGDTSAITPLIHSLEEEDSVFVRKELLEALGKVITQDKLKLLQYWPLKKQDDKEGLAWGLYRAGRRNIHDGVSIDIALSLLDKSNDYRTRLGAAHFLARTRDLDLTGRTSFISRAAISDVSPNVRMACALALKNAKEKVSFEALKKVMNDADYRVRVNALRALQVFNFDETQTIFFSALKDSNMNVGVTASSAILALAEKSDIEKINEHINDTIPARIKADLYGALLLHSDDQRGVIDDIIASYESSTEEYYKADLLAALSNSYLAYEFIITKTFSEQSKPISSAGINALAVMRSKKDFPKELQASFAEVFQQAIETKDVAMIYSSASVITNPDLNFREYYDSAKFLRDVRTELQLPKDMEAIQVLDRAIAFFAKEEYEPPVNEFNHPINWDLVKNIDSYASAVISTEKGDIILRLFVEDAPGSVANFVKLSREGYYNGKNFHRVVPNFVIQGGCNRGDGFGGEDYSIRSELTNLNYEEGSVGMASAGKDTEGTQWFITHSPTPHLDGGYTIFAKVTSGMEVVHEIEVGDKIISIDIK